MLSVVVEIHHRCTINQVLRKISSRIIDKFPLFSSVDYFLCKYPDVIRASVEYKQIQIAVEIKIEG